MELNLSSLDPTFSVPPAKCPDSTSRKFLEFQDLAEKSVQILLENCTHEEKLRGLYLWKTLHNKIQCFVEAPPQPTTIARIPTPQEQELQFQSRLFLQEKELTRATLDLEQEIRNLVSSTQLSTESHSQQQIQPIIIDHDHCDALVPPTGAGNLTELVPALPLRLPSIPNLLSVSTVGEAITAVSNLLDDDKALESVVEDVIGLEEEKNRKNEEAQLAARKEEALKEVQIEPIVQVPQPQPEAEVNCKNTKNSNNVICTICTASFLGVKELETHKKEAHTKLKHFKCTRCSSFFTTRGNLNVHIRSHTGEKPFACNKCIARFSSGGNLRRHLLSHQGLKPYRCPVCESTFTEKKSLLIHTRIHTGEKPFNCPHCPKEFSQRSVLQTHLSLHTTAKKPFACDKCNSAFRTKSQLTRHNKYIHVHSKTHHCTNCDASFVTAADLKRHESAHEGSAGGNSFICEICGLKFIRKYNLKIHIKKKHETINSSSA